MKKIIFLFAAGILLSCGDQQEEKEIELEDYNNTEPHENPELPAVNIAEDLVPVDTAATDSAGAAQDSVQTGMEDEKKEI